MRQVTKFLISTTMAATLMVGSVGVAVADDGELGQSRLGGILTRVAQILNIDAQTLMDAFKQAVTEIRVERQEAWLKNQIDNGTLTQEQADAYKAWIDSRPDIPGVCPANVDQLLKDGKITQEQYDSYKAWLDARPDIPLPFKQAGPGFGSPSPESQIQKLLDNGTLTQEQAGAYQTWLDSKPDIPGVCPRNMDQLLKDGKITQEQYDAYRAWLDTRPDVPMPQSGKFRQPGKPFGQKFRGMPNPPPTVSPETD